MKWRKGIAPPLCAPRIHAITRSSGRIRFLRFCVEQYEQGGSVRERNSPGPGSNARLSSAPKTTVAIVKIAKALTHAANLLPAIPNSRKLFTACGLSRNSEALQERNSEPGGPVGTSGLGCLKTGCVDQVICSTRSEALSAFPRVRGEKPRRAPRTPGRLSLPHTRLKIRGPVLAPGRYQGRVEWPSFGDLGPDQKSD